VRALQVKNARGEWVDAPPIEGAFVCNIGDMLELYTNGVCRSTTHRVLMPSAEEAADGRTSVPFFFEPNFDAIVSPLAAFGDVHEKYATPVKYGEHLRRKIEANFETDRVTMRARES
jgi:isopenicillin N synthase-like dioxygenase